MAEDTSSMEYMDDSDNESRYRPSVNQDKQAQWDQQGARPKYSSQLEKNFDVAHTTMSIKEKKKEKQTVRDAWAIINIRDLQFDIDYPIPEIDPCIAQRCFEVEDERTKFYKRGKQYFNRLEITENKTIEVELKNSEDTLSCIDAVKTALRGNISVVEELKGYSSNADILEYIMSLHIVAAEFVSVYKEQRTDVLVLHFVGNQSDIEDLQLSISKYRRSNRNDEYGCSSKQQIIKLSRGAKELLCHKSQKAHKHVAGKLKDEGVKALVRVNEKETTTGNEEIIVCAEDDQTLNKAVTVVKNCFIDNLVSKDVTEKLHSVLTTHTGSIYIVDDFGKPLSICYTSDMLSQVSHFLSNIKKENENSIQEYEFKCKIHTLNILEKLGCSEKLLEKFPRLKVRFKDQSSNSMVLSSVVNKELEDAAAALNIFESSVHFRKVSVDSRIIEMLKTGNQKAFAFVMSRLRQKIVNVHMEVTDEVTVYSFSKKHVIEGEKIIIDSFRSKKTSKLYIESVTGLVNAYKGCIIIEETSGLIECWFIVDLEQELDMIIEKGSLKVDMDSRDCNPVIEEFLNKYGKQSVEELETKYNVKINFSKGKCCIYGKEKCRNDAFYELHKKFPKTSQAMSGKKVVESYLSSKKHINLLVDDIAQKHKCCWSIEKTIDVGDEEYNKETALKGGKLCVSWRFGDFSSQLAVLQDVDYRLLNVDMLVFPVNTQMQGTYAWDIIKAGGDPFFKMCQSIKDQEPNVHVGKSFIVLEQLGNLKCGVVNALVICRAVNDTHGIGMKYMAQDRFVQSIQKVFDDASARKLTTVGFPVPEKDIDEYFTVEMCISFISWAVMAYLQNNKISSLKMIYLICDRDLVSKVATETEKNVQTLSTRRNVTPVLKGLFKKNRTKIEIQQRSLFEIKADCIVVAMAASKNLNEGKLSNILSNKAGEDLQRQLHLKHPSNLRDGEFVMLECSLKDNAQIKKVLVGYLPRWGKRKQTKILYTFVKDCLFASELEGCKTIAFPALGTGSLEYPQRNVAKMMLDGIDDYRRETMVRKLEHVIIAIVPQTKTDLVQIAFQHERTRRAKMKENKHVIAKPFGFPQLNCKNEITKKRTLTIRILEERNLAVPFPATFLDVHFRTERNEQPVSITRSSKNSFTWCDTVKCVCIDDANCLHTTINSVIKISEEEQFTGIIFHGCKQFHFSMTEQVNLIVKCVLSRSACVYLEEVVIATFDENGFSSLENSLLQQQPVPSMLSSWLGGLFKHPPVWQKLTDDVADELLTIDLVGVNQTGLDIAKSEIADVLRTRYVATHDESKTNDNDEANIDDNTSTTVDHSSVEDVDDGNDKQEDVIFGKVTADVHPKIITLYHDEKKLRLWEKHLKTTYDVDLLVSDTTMKVSGSLDSLLKLEDYMIDTFATCFDEDEIDQNLDSENSSGEDDLNFDSGHFENNVIKNLPMNESLHKGMQRFCCEEYKHLCSLLMTNPTLEGPCLILKFSKENVSRVNNILYTIKKKLQDLSSETIALEKKEFERAKVVVSTYANDMNDVSISINLEENAIYILGEEFEAVNIAKHQISVKIGKIKETVRRNRTKSPEQFFNCTSTVELPDLSTQSAAEESNSVFTLVNGIRVFIAAVDIRNVKVDAIACPGDSRFSGNGPFVADILLMAGVDHNNRYKKQSEVENASGFVKEIRVSDDGELLCKYVLHVVSPRWSSQHPQDFDNALKKTVTNVLHKSEELGIASLALPFIGTSDDEHYRQNHEMKCCERISDAVWRFGSETSYSPSLKQIHILSTDKAVVAHFTSVMRQLVSVEKETAV